MSQRNPTRVIVVLAAMAILATISLAASDVGHTATSATDRQVEVLQPASPSPLAEQSAPQPDAERISSESEVAFGQQHNRLVCDEAECEAQCAAHGCLSYCNQQGACRCFLCD